MGATGVFRTGSAPAGLPGTGAAGVEPILKTPAASTPSRTTTGDSQFLEEKRAQHVKSPRAAGFHMKKVATKPPVKQALASTAQAKDKSPAKKDSPVPAEKSTPDKDHPLDDY